MTASSGSGRLRRRLRVLLSAALLLGVVPPVVIARDARAETTTNCVFDPGAGTLAIGMRLNAGTAVGRNFLTIARTPDTDPGPGDNGKFDVRATGLSDADSSCGGAGVTSVNSVVLVAEGGEGSVLTTGRPDHLAVTIDLSNGRFGPGRDPEFDAFGDPSVDVGNPSVTLAEDGVAEIEFDLRYNLGVFRDSPFSARANALDLVITGGAGNDLVTLGSTNCNPVNNPAPDCRALAVNLNDDGDADVVASITGGAAIGSFGLVEVDGANGDDVLDARGGRGTGEPVFATGVDLSVGTSPGVAKLRLLGDEGDDALFGGTGRNEIHGGSGDDLIVGGRGGHDSLLGDDGDDVLDQGEVPTIGDTLSGGPGSDIVDYSRRTAPVRVTMDSVADDGEGSTDSNGWNSAEQDNVLSDVESARTSSVAPPAIPDFGLNVVGELESLVCKNRSANVRGSCPMAIDPVLNLGLATDGGTARLYDLEGLGEHLAQSPCGVGDRACPLGDHLAPDSKRRRMYGSWPLPPLDSDAVTNPARLQSCDLYQVRYFQDPGTGGWTIAPSALSYGGCVTPGVTTTPGEGGTTLLPGISLLDVFFDATNDDLYLIGSTLMDHSRRPTDRFFPGFTASYGYENLGSTLIVRKVHLDDVAGSVRATAEWDLDLRYAGCGRRVGVTYLDAPIPRFVARLGDDLLAYCWDPKPQPQRGAIGEQGYMVRIPLAGGRPVARGGGALQADPNGSFMNYRAVRTPTLPGSPTVLADPGSNTVILVTDDPINGNAAWVFDPSSDSFVGVGAGGVVDQPIGNTAVGIDSSRGRTYLLTRDGVVAFPLRARPLPAGQSFPVAANNPISPHKYWANFPTIAVAPRLHRLFIPVRVDAERGGVARWVVADDVVPDPDLPRRDPDVNTVQVEETPGVTEASARAQASASGAHVIVAGGVTRTVDSADPACFANVPVIKTLELTFQIYGGEIYTNDARSASFPPLFANGGCAAEQVLAAGHREFALSATSAESSSGESVIAGAAGLAFGPNDVTKSDVQAPGHCEAALLGGLTRGQLPPEFTEPHGAMCEQFWEGASDSGAPDLRAGTQGADGRGFPIQTATCGDFSGAPDDEAVDQRPFGGSKVRCDLDESAARATADAAGLMLSIEDEPVITVARTASSIQTVKGVDGQVTVVSALAEGVRIGPLSIREVRSVAVTQARGRAGTAGAQLERRWCGVTVSGEDPVPSTTTSSFASTTTTSVSVSPAAVNGCIDPAHPDNRQFVEDLNVVLAGKVRVTVPQANEETEPDGTVQPGEDSPGGYEAVVIKHPDARGGDQVVNDDESHAVAGLQAVVYNDGPNGRNRYVVQLAGVHAESRYGITVLPRFQGFTDGDSAFSPGAPGARGVIPGRSRVPAASRVIGGKEFRVLLAGSGLPAPEPGHGPGNPLRPLLEALKDLLRLLIQHPLEFLLLFMFLSLLAAPGYLAHKRRAFARLVA